VKLDFSDDWLCWDNVSQVRYEVARGVPSIVDVPPAFDGHTGAPQPQPSRNKPLIVTVAKRRNLTARELAASGGVYRGDDQVYLLPDALMEGIIPKPADVIIELADGSAGAQPGTRWTVLDAARNKNRQTHRLTCRDLVLAFDLRDSITIERPSLSYDAAGVPVKAFPSDTTNAGGVVLYSGLPARVQLITKDMAEQRGIRGLEGKYHVIVGQEVDVTQEDRVLLASGLYLDIVGYERAMRIDELPQLICERRI
jgi:hypothetical protein